MNTFRLCLFIVLGGCLSFFCSCDEIENLTESTYTKKEASLVFSEEVVQDSGSGEAGELNAFKGSQMIAKEDLLGDELDRFSKIKSISVEKVTITIESPSGTKVKEFSIVQQQTSPREFKMEGEYTLGDEYESENLTKFAAAILNKMINTDNFLIEYSGLTDIPIGTEIKYTINFNGLKVTGNLL